MQWFEVSKSGLANLLERRGKEFILFEIAQNAFDQRVTRVLIRLSKEPGARHATLRVEDDDPDGFQNLAHAFTLFADSVKKGEPTQRGRFNLGEKLVLALCEEAEIRSTRGGVRFDGAGRHAIRQRRARGTVFEGRLKMTNAEHEACCAAVQRLLPPAGVEVTFNGAPLPARAPIATFEAVLRTEVADAEGRLKPTQRKTAVHVHRPRPGETGTLYEMGIPVVETGDAYHVDVQQKVPVNLDRDNVPPAYLRALRTLVLNAVHAQLEPEQANASWVRDALTDERVSAAAVRTAVELRFGPKAVAYDPSDAEANKLAVSAGYTVVAGGHLSKEEWANVRRAGVLLPAGQVTPSPKPYSDDPDAPSLTLLAPERWSEAERAFVERARRIAQALLGCAIDVRIAVDITWPFAATYGGRELTLNKGRLGERFFAEGLSERAVDLLIHEFAHHVSGDHLSKEYHDALSRLGARLALAAARDPGLLL